MWRLSWNKGKKQVAGYAAVAAFQGFTRRGEDGGCLATREERVAPDLRERE
jgi:hypothetical protein